MSAVCWSEEALALFDLGGHTAVEAGAGSGKTTALVELAVRLLSGEATGTPLEPSELVAITFTEKAAEELSERLRAAVAERLGRAEPGSEEARTWRIRLAGLDRIVTGTIHAFCAGLLREHAPEAGVDPEFAQLDEEAAGAWRLEAAREAVLEALAAGRGAAAELAAVHGAAGGRGLADLAEALSRERASRGLSGPVPLPPPPAGEAEAARDALVDAARDLLAATADVRTASMREAAAAFAAAWAEVEPADLAGPVTRATRRRILAAARAARKRVGSRDGPRLAAARAALDAAARDLEDRSADALGRAQAEELARLVRATEARYAARKAGARALDFDDLLLGARDLLRRDLALLGELRGRIRALLLDEVQDVNPVQQEIADLLCGRESAERPGPAAILVAVGDPKQSIYRFRGADVGVFRGLVERMAAGEGRVLRLADNHRSTPAVLEVVNAIAACALQPAGTPARPYEVVFSAADRMRPRREGGRRPACEILESGDEGSGAERRGREARAIAERIAALVSGSAGVLVADGHGAPRRPRWGDVALLFRRLTRVADYERALRQAAIPYRLARGGGFYRASEVRDLGELLASLFDPGDAIAWAALLRSPLCGLADVSLALLARTGLASLAGRRAEEAAALLERDLAAVAPPESNPTPSAEAGRLLRFLSVWQDLRARRDRLALPDLLAEAADRLDLEAALLAAPDGERRRDNLRKAIALARRHAAAGGAARAFATRLRALAHRPPREPEAELPAEEAVALLSVHQAKGLEWPIVFVPDMGAPPRVDGRLAALDGAGRLCAAWADPESGESVPGAALRAARDEEARAAAAESRRLLYVALTRARDTLVLSGATGRGSRDTWRRLVEAGLAARPDLVLRVPAGEASRLAAGPPVPAPAPADPPHRGTTGAPRLAPPPPLAAVRAAVTDLAEFARCPSRHFLARVVRLPERPSPPGAPGDDPERATALGTLAHAMLARLDLAAPPLERRAHLAACARRLGHDPAAAGPRRVLADVTRFLESPRGRQLVACAAAGRLRREVPFLLRLDGAGGPPCYLVGALDALVEEGGELRVVDFKYALPRRESAARYRLQLAAYALAVSRAHPGRRVRAGLQFLRGRCDAVDLSPSPGELAAFAREAPRLAAALHAGAGAPPPAALGRTRERCEAEGCGYVYRCYRTRE